MFERQLGLRENPFLSGHQPKYVYPSREHQEALAHLRYGIQNGEPFVLITGEVGTGKTTAVYDALSEWGPRAVVALITNSALTRTELLEEICLRFGVAAPGPMSKPQTLVQLERLLSAVRARGELAILLLDEAQNLDRELLEEIRLLSNLEVQGEKLLQIFLVGQPELEAKLAQPELRQLRQRIAIHYRISPLSATETAHYIHHRVSVAGGNANALFPAETCVEIFRITNGIPREINIVAGQSLLNAFVEDAQVVTPEHVKAVEREIEFQSVLSQSQAVTPPPLTLVPRPAANAAPVASPPATVHATPAPVHPVQAPAIPGAQVPQPPIAPAASAMPSSAAPARPEPAAPRAPEEPRILPGWFDEVLARQKTAHEAATVQPASESALPASRSIPREIEEAPMPFEGPEPAAPAAPAQPMYASAAAPVAPETTPPAPLFTPVAAPPLEPVRPSARETVAPPAPSRPPLKPVAEVVPAIERPEFRALVTPPRSERTQMDADEGASDEATRSSEPPRDRATDFISPRLRAKLAEAEEQAPRAGIRLGWLAAVPGLAVLVTAAVLLFRFGPLAPKPHAPAPSAPAPAQPAAVVPGPGGSAAPATTAGGSPPTGVTSPTTQPKPGASPAAPSKLSPSATPNAGSTAGAGPGATQGAVAAAKPAPAKPAVRPPSTTHVAAARPSAGGATGTRDASVKGSAGTAAPKSASGVDRFGIAVGTYINEDRANTERSSLSETTQLPARVLAVTEDGGAMYRVVMGSFESRVAAERAASDLIRRGLVNEARVVPLARATPTQ